MVFGFGFFLIRVSLFVPELLPGQTVVSCSMQILLHMPD